MTRRHQLCLFLWLLILPGFVQAATYYASTSGGGSTCSIGSPCTLNGGIAKVSAGDTLYLRQGTYNQRIHPADQTIPSGSGTGAEAPGAAWPNAITIASYPSESATITGGIGIQGNINGSQPSYLIFDRLIIDKGITSGGDVPQSGAAFYTSGGLVHHIRFQNGEVKNNADNLVQVGGGTNNVEIINSNIHHAYVSLYGGTHPTTGNYGFYYNGHNGLIEGNTIHDNTGYGLHLFHSGGTDVDSNIVRNNSFYTNGFDDGERNNPAAGVIIASGANNLFYNNLVYGNTGIGVQVAYTNGDTNNQIYNNTIYNNSGSGIEIFDSALQTKVRDNIVYANGGTIIDWGAPGTQSTINTNVTTNPLFVNAGGADFHLQSGSPAINTGVCLSAVPTDIAGVSRPQGAGCDIGAYEFGGTVSPLAVSLTASPTSRTVGQLTTATWTVTTGNANAVDYVALFLVGDSPANKVANDGAGLIGWTYTNGASGGTFPTTVPNLAPGASVSYEFRYCVNDSTTCIATSQTVTVTGPVIAAPHVVLSSAGMSVSPSPAGCDSEETAALDNRCLNVLDNNPMTFWHTVWSTTPPPQPHQIIINLGGSYAVSGWVYLPRQDGCANGTISSWSLSVSTDGTTWGAALISGTFASNATEKIALAGSSQVGNYIKIMTSSAVAGVGGCGWSSTDTSGVWTSAADIYVLINPGAGSYTITQARYRWFAADGGLLPGCGENQVCGAASGETRQLRVKVTATLGNPPSLGLQINCRTNAAAFAVLPVNGSTGVNVCMGLGTGFISGQATNRALTLDQAAFLPGAYVSVTPTVQSIDLSQNSETEYVWFIATPPGLSSGTTVDCKVVFGDGSAMQVYTVNPAEVLQNAQLRLGGTSVGGVTFR